MSHLDNCSPGNHAQRSIHLTIGVLLDPNYLKIKSAFQFWVGNMSFGKPQAHRPDEALVLWWFSCESWPNKCHFGDHPLPLLGCMRKHKKSELFMKRVESILTASRYSRFLYTKPAKLCNDCQKDDTSIFRMKKLKKSKSIFFYLILFWLTKNQN